MSMFVNVPIVYVCHRHVLLIFRKDLYDFETVLDKKFSYSYTESYPHRSE